jgi:superfamily II helicase
MSFDVEIARKSFMIIDKESMHKKRNYYNLFIFRLNEDVPSQGILRYISTPVFKGMVEFERSGEQEIGIPEWDKEHPIEATRLWKRIAPPDIKNLKNDLELNLKPLDPRLFQKMFVNARFIVIPSDQVEEENTKPIYDLASRLQREDNQKIEIRRYALCTHCSKRRTFTLLGQDDHFTGYNKKLICKDCAGKEVFQLLKKETNMDISPQLKMILSRQLLKFRSVAKVMLMFAGNFNPVTNSDLTLYDRRDVNQNLIERMRKIKTLKLRDLEINAVLKEYYIHKRIEELLPIQTLAIEQGLLQRANLLVISSTSSGKTLLGELAGFNMIIDQKFEQFPLPPTIEKLPFKEQKIAYTEFFKKIQRTRAGKMLYLVPIVALANMRFEEYKELRKIGIVCSLKVGKSFFEEELDDEFGSIDRADIIIATYEAVDVMLRGSGGKSLGSVDTIVIDEIQMLSDDERGYILDGMIARLKYLYPHAQILFLSATVSDPKHLSDHYECKLIEFRGRPVPLERHLIMMLNDFEKMKSLLLLVAEEFKKTSTAGFRGQTLIFTNSRRKCQSIAEFMSNNGVKAEAYHGGLTFIERRKVEDLFNKQFIPCIVTTAALAAGVDFACSQVIFESLSMGIKWLTVAEFEQMCGRAGRYGKHDMAKAVILCEPGKTYNSGQVDGEEKAAVRLLNGKLEPIELEPDEDRMYTETLAFISMRSGYLVQEQKKGAPSQIPIERGVESVAEDHDDKFEFRNGKSKDLIAEFAEKMKREGKIGTKPRDLPDENSPLSPDNSHNKRNKEGRQKPIDRTCGVRRDIMEFQKYMFNNNFNMDVCLKQLEGSGCIGIGNMQPTGVLEIGATPFGRAVAESFFTLSKCMQIRKSLETGKNLFDLSDENNPSNLEEVPIEDTQKNSKDRQKTHYAIIDDSLPILIAIYLNPFKNIYVSNAVVKELAPKSGDSKSSSLLFGNSTLALLSAENFGRQRNLSKFITDLMLTWSKEIFNCGCQDSPYCDCGRINVQKKILQLGMMGKALPEILQFLQTSWQLKIYMGDLMDYFDSMIHVFKSINKIGRALNLNNDIKLKIEQIPDLLKSLTQ